MTEDKKVHCVPMGLYANRTRRCNGILWYVYHDGRGAFFESANVPTTGAEPFMSNINGSNNENVYELRFDRTDPESVKLVTAIWTNVVTKTRIFILLNTTHLYVKGTADDIGYVTNLVYKTRKQIETK